MEYRAISLHQPWASLVALGIKRYETRSWSTKFRGKLLICSAKKYPVTVDLMKSAGLIWSEYPELFPEDMGGKASEAQIELVKQLGWQWRNPKERLMGIHWYANSSPYFHTGRVLCVVDLVDCLKMESHPPHKENIILEDVPELEQLCGDWQAGRYAWELTNLMPLLEPIPIKGKQGLWIPDSSIITEVEKQIKEQL
jgi:hypothetical protein